MLYGPLKCMAKMKMSASGGDFNSVSYLQKFSSVRLHLQVEENEVE